MPHISKWNINKVKNLDFIVFTSSESSDDYQISYSETLSNNLIDSNISSHNLSDENTQNKMVNKNINLNEFSLSNNDKELNDYYDNFYN